MTTPQTLYLLRKALGFSHTQMAAALGLGGARALDTVREMETDRREISGAVANVARYLSQAVDVSTDPALSDSIQTLIPRFLDCTNLADDEDGTEIAIHTQWPRFYALYPDAEPLDADTRADMIDGGMTIVPMPVHIGGGDMFILWIDDPAPDTSRAKLAVTECARLKTAQAERYIASE